MALDVKVQESFCQSSMNQSKLGFNKLSAGFLFDGVPVYAFGAVYSYSLDCDFCLPPVPGGDTSNSY